jgi:hypothetical protein
VQPLQLLHRDASRGALVFFQIYVFGLWLVRIAAEPLHRLAVLPPGYYDPVGVLRLLPDSVHAWLLSMEALVALRSALLVALALSLWPRAFRYSAPVASLLLLLRLSLIHGFGGINHGLILSLLAAITLAAFANLPRSKPSPGYNPHAVPLITVAFIITLSYSLVGLTRLQTGISIFTGDTIINYVVSRSLRSYYYDFNLGLTVVSWAPAAYLLRGGFPLVTLVELLAPLVLVSRWWRGIFLAVMVPFHLVTLVLMEVDFMENLLLYVVLVNFSPFVDRWMPSYAGSPPTSAVAVSTASPDPLGGRSPRH